MSYDFDIATRARPGPLEPILARLGVSARIDGRFEPDRNCLVTRLGEAERTIDVEGPEGYEPEDLAGDLDAAFAAAAPGARWLCGIHLPGGYAEPADRWVVDLAVELARSSGGAVWDPQAERVVWPDAGPAAIDRSARTGERPPDYRTKLVWHVPQARAPRDLPARLLDLLRRFLPEALPGRFGPTEPYQHRLERDGDDAFVADWQALAERESFVTWDGATRGWHGFTRFRRGDGARLVPDVVISLDGVDNASHDRAVADRLADGLVGVADALDAAYAQAHLEPTAYEFVRGGVPVVKFRDMAALGWAGLPLDPTWLAWFGRPYAELLRDRLADHVDLDTERGFLIRTSALARRRDELDGLFPPLPPELVQEEWFLVSPTDGTPIARLRRAVEIPRLDP